MSERIRIFSPENREAILAQQVGKPTGHTVTLGSVTFDLIPFTTREGLAVFALIKKFAAMLSKDGEATTVTLATAIGEEGERIHDLLKAYLKRCAGVLENEEVTFEEWFAQQPLLILLRTLIPAAIKANAISDLVTPRPPEAVAVSQPTPPSSPSPTQSS